MSELACGRATIVLRLAAGKLTKASLRTSAASVGSGPDEAASQHHEQARRRISGQIAGEWCNDEATENEWDDRREVCNSERKGKGGGCCDCDEELGQTDRSNHESRNVTVADQRAGDDSPQPPPPMASKMPLINPRTGIPRCSGWYGVNIRTALAKITTPMRAK